MQSDPETAANTMLCLVNQASYLLRNQLRRQEQDFLKKSGFTERVFLPVFRHVGHFGERR